MYWTNEKTYSLQGILYKVAPLNTFRVHKLFPSPPQKKIPIFSSVSTHISDTDGWIHTKRYTSSERVRITFRPTRELIAKTTGIDKVVNNDLCQHKAGNVCIKQRPGAFVQPLLQYKSNNYYVFRKCISVALSIQHAPYCHLWSVRLYNTAWFKKMYSISYVYISWTIHGIWMIYITFERGG